VQAVAAAAAAAYPSADKRTSLLLFCAVNSVSNWMRESLCVHGLHVHTTASVKH